MEKYAAVILGAGKGTRMNASRQAGLASPIPKIMFELNGKPIIDWSVKLIRETGIETVVLIVGYKKELIEEYFGDKVEYAEQVEQLGTGHAVMMAEDILKGKAESIIIFYGDNCLYKPESVRRIIDLYEKENPTIAILTVSFNDPMFWAFGRILRDKEGKVIGIREQKDCSEEELKIKESNPGFYIVDSNWLWKNLKNLKKQNTQGEYYLTDIIEIAKEQGKKIVATPVFEESEALGINTLEQLKEAETVLLERNDKLKISNAK